MRYLIWIVAVPLAVTVLIGAVLERKLPFTSSPRWVITFSPAHARYLGLEPGELFSNIIRDFSPSHLRLQANWNEIEPAPGEFTFGELDGYIAAAR
ncbi:MAG: hypothetical protein U1C53_00025, partial [Candidatus Veblenbacteria bacterium]|nr:hypothetical protein [Candidatus Veblenbacteria bacterium]